MDPKKRSSIDDLAREIPKRCREVDKYMFRPLPRWFQILNLSNLAEALRKVHHVAAEQAPEELEWNDVVMTDAP